MFWLRANPALFLVFCVFLIKLVFFSTILINEPDFFAGDGDTGWYTIFTDGFINFGGFSDGRTGVAEVFRLPGYPAFLLPFWGIEEPYRYAWVSLFQLVCGHIWLAFGADTLAKRLSPAVGIAFVLLLSIHFLFNHTVGAIQSEALFIPLVTLPIFAVLRIKLGASVILMGGISALALAGAHLTRPDILYLPVLLIPLSMAMIIFGRGKREDVPTRQGKVLFIGVLGGLFAMGLWSLRNLLVAGSFMLTSHTGHVMAVMKHRLIGSNRNDHLMDSGTDVVMFALTNLEPLMMKFGLVLFNLFIRPHRWYLHRYADSFGVPELVVKEPLTVERLTDLTWLEYVYIGYVVSVGVALVILTLLGLWFQWRRSQPKLTSMEVLLVLLPLLYLLSVQIIWGGEGRFATVMLPFMTIFAAFVFLNVRRVPTLFSGR
jgi:hypothetical protein